MIIIWYNQINTINKGECKDLLQVCSVWLIIKRKNKVIIFNEKISMAKIE